MRATRTIRAARRSNKIMRALPIPKDATYSVRTIKSSNPLKSPTNEDRFSIRHYPTFSLFGIFDGHLGTEIANYSSTHFLRFLGNRIQNSTDLHTTISNSFVEFNKKLLEYFPKNRDGCTVTIVYVDPEKILTANAGDSPAILIRKGRGVRSLSTEHSWENKAERKRIQDAGGKFEDGYYVIGTHMIQPTRGFGDFFFKRHRGTHGEEIHTAVPTITTHVLTDQDVILFVGTDGVGDAGPILASGYRNYLRSGTKMGAPRFLEQWVFGNPRLFGSKPYYPDDVTTIIVDIQALRRAILKVP